MKVNRSQFGACIGKIATKGNVDENEAGDLLDGVASRAENDWRAGDSNAFYKAAQELAQKEMDAAKRAKLDALRNAMKRADVMAEIKKNGGLSNAAEVLHGLLRGSWKGTRDSIESRWKGVSVGWQAALSQKLHAAGLEKVAISGEIDNDIARELYAMNMPGPKPEKSASVTGNNPARQIAEIIHPMLEYARERANDAGAQIGKAADFVAQTRHDPDKMRAAAGSMRATPDEAFKAWWGDTKPLLSDRTFEDVVPRGGETMQEARDRFGRSVFDALITGVHMTPAGTFGIKDVGPAFEGTRNLAKKLSQPRVLSWKDGEAWNAYMEKYGVGNSLTHGVMMTLDKAARSIALMEKLGTNPAGNLNQIIRAVQETYRSDLDGIKNFGTKTKSIQNEMAHLDGSANIPTNHMWSRIFGNYRTFTSMADLGGVGITHFASIWPTVTSEMAHHGVSRMETLGNMVAALVRGKGSEERQAVLSELGAYGDGLSRDMMGNWNGADNVSGKMAALANVFMKYTGIHYVFDNTQAAVREMLAHNLGRNVGKDFASLDPHVSAMLSRYGIDARDWDLLRAVPDLPTSNGRAYLTPKDALRVDRNAVADILRERGEIAQPDLLGAVDDKAIDRYTQDLSDKLYSYYGESARHSTVSAGVRERAMMLGGTNPGSLGGEALRFMTQFKMWPVAAYDQLLRRDYFLSQGTREYAWNLGMLVGLSAIGGYTRMSINDIAVGNQPRDPLKPETLLAAVAQGGGFGILGDFLFGETNRFGGGLADILVGPAIGDAATLFDLMQKAKGDSLKLADGRVVRKSGAYGDLWPEIARFGVRHVPFANLAYIKGALDYLLWYHLYEAASPGWWERTNRKMVREQGRTMAAYTPGAGVPFGVPYAYLKTPAGTSSGLFAANSTIH
jgi:hypothetical protein